MARTGGGAAFASAPGGLSADPGRHARQGGETTFDGTAVTPAGNRRFEGRRGWEETGRAAETERAGAAA